MRSACTAMNASLFRFALKSFPQAKEVDKTLIQATLDCVSFCFLSKNPGTPVTPGWDSPAYVSNLANALRPDTGLGVGLLEFAAYMKKICGKIERNCPIKKVAIQKQHYSILINNIPNGCNTLVSKRLAAFGIDSNLSHDSLEFFKLKLKMIQPHLRMSFIKTLTNGWHTASRMHEAICLPCIFGCNALPNNCLAPIDATLPSSIKDETASYLICPILLGIISQASGLDHLPTLQELILGNNINDLTGALACATSYHVYHSLKLGNLPIIQKSY